MKKTTLMFLGLTLLTATIEARNISTEDKITGLYVAFFNRAPDNKGLQIWKNKAESRGGDALTTLKEISTGFASHNVFKSTYEHLNNRAFVEAIYRNSLGRDGDETGIVNWVNSLENGMSRSDMVANFISSALTVDLTTQNFPTLTAQELQEAQKRQDLITNKVTVALKFTNLLGDKTNVTDSDFPENDPAYLASIDILAGITEDTETVSERVSSLESIQFDENPITSILNLNPRQQNRPPIANAGADITVTVNQSITIRGSGTDNDGVISEYIWKKGNEVLGTTSTLTYTPTIVGTDTLTLTVTDDDGLTATDSINISVIASTASHQIPILSDTDREEYLDAINRARSIEQDCHSHGVFPATTPLVWNDKLYKASYEHTNDLVQTETFSHDGSGTEHDWTGYALGKTSDIVERVENYDYNWGTVGENIAAGTNTSTAEIVIQQWLDSDGHCANLMSSDYTEIGMAMIYKENSRYKYYWTQDFGTPR